MFGIIALLVIQAAINVGLLLKVRKLEKRTREFELSLNNHGEFLLNVRRDINKLTYKP